MDANAARFCARLFVRSSVRLRTPVLLLSLVLVGQPAPDVSVAHAGSSYTYYRSEEMQEAAEQTRREAERQMRRAQREAERRMRQMEREMRRIEQEQRRMQEEANRQADEAARRAAREAEAQMQEAARVAREGTREQAEAALESAREAVRRARELANQATARQGSTSGSSQSGNAQTSNSSGSEKDQSGTQAAPVEVPPRTLVELVDRLTGSSANSTAGTGAPTIDTSVPADRTDPLPKPAMPSAPSNGAKGKKETASVSNKKAPLPPAAKPVQARAGAQYGGGGPVRPEMDFPSLGEREFLAANLSAPALGRLRGLGFEPRGANVVGLFNFSITRLAAPSGMPAEQAKALLKSELPNETIAQNRIYRPYRAAASATPALKTPDSSVQRLPASSAPCPAERCYAMQSVKWSDAHLTCAPNFRIGVIDTAADLSHPTFRGSHISVGTFQSGPKPSANATHGTGILSLLAGRRGSGTPGLLPDAHFFMADVFFAGPDGQPMTDTVNLLKAFDWLSASDVRVVNMSVAGPRDDLVAKAIEALARNGVIITAAAGNSGPAAGPSYPAAYPQVVSVTAIDREQHAYRHANRGTYIDLSAPGVGVWTAYPDATEGPQTGTSFAVPFATAAIAAVYDSLPQKTKAYALAALSTQDLGTPGQDPTYGRGLLTASPTCGRVPTPPAPAAPVATAARETAPASLEILPWSLKPAGSTGGIGLGFSE